jgi:hypothetical protein
MKLETKNSLQLLQSLGLKQISVAVLIIGTVLGIAVFLISTFKSEMVYAKVCENSYTLDWSDSNTYTVTCGLVNPAQWSVKGMTCNFYSPLLTVGGPTGGTEREVSISVRINQSGNLDVNDTAWVYYYVNGSIYDTYIVPGDSISSVFVYTNSIAVPSGGTYSLHIRLMNDKQNELWQIKDGDITACLKPLSPLPISLLNFKGKQTKDNDVLLEWITQTELNNDFFILERSTDGINFSEIANVDGAGTSSTINKYNFTDISPTDGINHYRLTNVDFDGTSVVLKVITVNVNLVGAPNGSLVIAPNPFATNFSARLFSNEKQVVKLYLVNLSGAVVYSNSYQLNTGDNKLEVAVPSSLQKGLYSVQVVGKSGIISTAKAVRN